MDRDRTAPSIADIEQLADAALHVIPPALRQHVRDVVIHVEDFPDEETCREMALESAFDLLGLYRGVAIGRKRSEEHTSELQSLMRISYAVLCLKKKKKNN